MSQKNNELFFVLKSLFLLSPNKHAENVGARKRRHPEETPALDPLESCRSAVASKSSLRVKGRTLGRHRLTLAVRTPRRFRPRHCKHRKYQILRQAGERLDHGLPGAEEAARGIRRMIAATMAFLRTRPRQRVMKRLVPLSVRPHPLFGRFADESLVLAMQRLCRREGVRRAVVRLRH